MSKHVRYHLQQSHWLAVASAGLTDDEKRCYASRAMLRICCMDNTELHYLAHCLSSPNRPEHEVYEHLVTLVKDYTMSAPMWRDYIVAPKQSTGAL